jgi:hypothetical protein
MYIHLLSYRQVQTSSRNDAASLVILVHNWNEDNSPLASGGDRNSLPPLLALATSAAEGNIVCANRELARAAVSVRPRGLIFRTPKSLLSWLLIVTNFVSKAAGRRREGIVFYRMFSLFRSTARIACHGSTLGGSRARARVVSSLSTRKVQVDGRYSTGGIQTISGSTTTQLRTAINS